MAAGWPSRLTSRDAEPRRDAALLLAPGTRRALTIWVDADACPRPIKDILYRAAERTRTPMVLVANMPLRVPPSALIRTLRVRRGFNVADREIVEQVASGDIVVTADIPLAAEIVGRGAHALDPRGVAYTADNIPERLAVRNLMAELRASGVPTAGPASWSAADTRAFANQLDRLLSTGGPPRE
jgi:uncharacterized protein YaiI (UPF0178 family)